MNFTNSANRWRQSGNCSRSTTEELELFSIEITHRNSLTHAKISGLGMQVIYNMNVSNICWCALCKVDPPSNRIFFCPQPFKVLVSLNFFVLPKLIIPLILFRAILISVFLHFPNHLRCQHWFSRDASLVYHASIKLNDSMAVSPSN